MARLFDDGSTETLTVESPAITAYPLGMAGWANVNDDAVNHVLGWVGNKDEGDEWTSLFLTGGSKTVTAFSHGYGFGSEQANSSTSWSANNWIHCAGVWLGVAERHAYLDGGNKGSDTNAVDAMVNHDRTTIGWAGDNSPGGYVSGSLAEIGMWDLTDWGVDAAAQEVAFEKAIVAMAKGYSPLFFPLGLVAYWPLVSGINDRVGGFNMTANGTVKSAHPRIIYPSKIWTPSGEAAVPPVGNAGIMTTNAGFWGPTF